MREAERKSVISGKLDDYADILELPHHISATRPQMPMSDRAAQFSPFAALVGYEDAVRETGRLTQERSELDEIALQELDRRLQILQEQEREHPQVSITYFKADERKEGGAYLEVSGSIKKLDTANRLLMLQDGTAIFLEDIYRLESDTLFSAYE